MPSSKKKLTLKLINQDIVAFNGLKSIKNYKPNRSDLSLAALEESYQKMLEAQRHAIEKQAQQKAAVAAQNAAEKEFHAKIVDMKDCFG